EESPDKRYHELVVCRSAIAQHAALGERVRKAVEIDRFHALEQGLRFGDVGGWAIAMDRRKTTEPLRTILVTFGLLNLLGGSVGLATATYRHGSASILRRLGLSPLIADGVQLPIYHDPEYRCDMEVLRFDSRRPNPKYEGWVAELTAHLATAPVICAEHDPLS